MMTFFVAGDPKSKQNKSLKLVDYASTAAVSTVFFIIIMIIVRHLFFCCLAIDGSCCILPAQQTPLLCFNFSRVLRYGTPFFGDNIATIGVAFFFLFFSE